jgi:hypothetical protein
MEQAVLAAQALFVALLLDQSAFAADPLFLKAMRVQQHLLQKLVYHHLAAYLEEESR